MSDGQKVSGKLSLDAIALRKRAEEQVKTIDQVVLSAHSPEEIQQILHELTVHQVELEMQNEELRKAQGLIEASRARYLDLYDLAPVGYCTIDEKGLMLESNLTFAKMLGVNRRMVIEKPFTSFILSEDQDVFYLLRRKHIGIEDPQVCELRMVRSDNTTFWASLHVVEMQDENGPKHLRITISDCSKRKITQQRLQESEEKHRRLFETMSPGVIYQDLEGSIISANPAAEGILGSTLELMQGKTSFDSSWKMITEDGLSVPGSEHPAMIALRTGKSIGPVTRGVFIPESDDYVWLSITSIPLYREGENQPFQTYSIFNDVTESRLAAKKMEEYANLLEMKNIELDAVAKEAEKANQSKSRYLAHMNHEMRTPLNGIIGFLQLLENTGFDEEQQEFMYYIKHSITHMLSIINNVLDFAKIEAGAMELDNCSFDLEREIGIALALLRSLVYQKDVHLDVVMDTSLPSKVVGDPDRLRQILLNLGGNAVKFTQKGYVRITIDCPETTKDHHILHLVVEDTGSGMKQEMLEKLFQPFFQVDDGSTRQSEGTGLGLVITRELVDLMNGEILVDSSYGKGTQVEVTLKLARSID